MPDNPVTQPQTKDWYDLLIEKGRAKADSIDDEFSREATKIAFKLLESNKKDFVGIGRDAFQSLITSVASGQTEEAVKKYIEKIAEADELIQGMKDSAQRIELADKLYRENHQRIRNIIGKVSSEAARYLLPIILGTL